MLIASTLLSVLVNAAAVSGGRHAVAQEEQPPFRLPFDAPSGPSTWYLIQFYGNTQNAYYFRRAWYGQGQGLHFGVDFSVPCGTEIVAIGDGEIAKVDALSHGSGPHNLMIVHPNGYASFYGHLLERSSLEVGQQVRQGQVVGLTGDPDLTCTSRPHLHLEIRNTSYSRAYNPVLFIDADWDSLALLSPGNPFQRDLDNPRRWMTPYDQPNVDFGGQMLNEYANPWPPDWY
ncbi:MAG: M23 family metallopeptidase [Anaerolineae bacterium]|nr:M23 family metallopeptidase [Anaerolineae bacterium]